MKRLIVASVVACVGIPFVVAASDDWEQQRGAPPPAAPVPTQTPSAAPAPPADYKFASGAGMFFFYVKPEKVTDFEAVVAKIGEALDKTPDPARRQQAIGWRIYKSVETPREGVVYVFAFDPALATADYDPVRLLSETLPAEVQGLYDRLKDAIVRVERMGLTKIR